MRNLELICIGLILFPLYISGQVPAQQTGPEFREFGIKDPEIGIIEKLDTILPVRGFCISAPQPAVLQEFVKFIDEE